MPTIPTDIAAFQVRTERARAHADDALGRANMARDTDDATVARGAAKGAARYARNAASEVAALAGFLATAPPERMDEVADLLERAAGYAKDAARYAAEAAHYATATK